MVDVWLSEMVPWEVSLLNILIHTVAVLLCVLRACCCMFCVHAV